MLPFVDEFRTLLISEEVSEYMCLETQLFCLEAKETI